MHVIFVNPLLQNVSCRTGTPISKNNGLPTHPLTAIAAAATPQRLFYSGCPLSAAILPQVGSLVYINLSSAALYTF